GLVCCKPSLVDHAGTDTDGRRMNVAVHLGFWLAAAIELYGEVTQMLPLIYAAKPTAIGLLLLAAVRSRSPYRIQYVIALVFCMIGDILLMLPSRPFVPGLAAFLVAHLAYIATFLRARTAVTDAQAALPYRIAGACVAVVFALS